MGIPTAFRSLGLESETKFQTSTVLFKYTSGALGRKPCIYAHLHRLVTNLHE